MERLNNHLNITFLKPLIINFGAWVLSDVNQVIGTIGAVASTVYAVLKLQEQIKNKNNNV